MTGMTGVFCVALFLAVTSVSAVLKLHSINGLKKINFGQSVPKHSLLLLYWFANAVDIDENDIMRLTFDPNRDYSSHHYGNNEGLLDDLPLGNVRYQYYTIGNLNQETSMQLPPYVVRPLTEYVGSNLDRIIIRVREMNTGRRAQQMIDQVYITQHYDISENMGTVYDPAHTYRITTNLMRQIREFSVGENQQQLLQLRNRFRSNINDSWLRQLLKTWTPNLAGLGLLLYIVIQEKDSSNQRNNRQKKRQNRLADASERKVHRNVRNQEYVQLRDVDEDLEANRTTLNRQSDIASRDQNRRRLWGCCIAICFITIVSAICIILYFYLRR